MSAKHNITVNDIQAEFHCPGCGTYIETCTDLVARYPYYNNGTEIRTFLVCNACDIGLRLEPYQELGYTIHIIPDMDEYEAQRTRS